MIDVCQIRSIDGVLLASEEMSSKYRTGFEFIYKEFLLLWIYKHVFIPLKEVKASMQSDDIDLIQRSDLALFIKGELDIGTNTLNGKSQIN